MTLRDDLGQTDAMHSGVCVALLHGLHPEFAAVCAVYARFLCEAAKKKKKMFPVPFGVKVLVC